jgi:hypothetical protein
MKLIFCCEETNDLYRLLASLETVERRDTPEAAVRDAEAGAGVLLPARDYPDRTTQVSPEVFDLAKDKGLKLYLEYPTSFPNITVGPPQRTVWERQVITTDRFGPALPQGSLLHLHGCHYVSIPSPSNVSDPWAVIAQVAGYDRAVYGVSADAVPLLFELADPSLLVATSKLSGFVTGRYGPVASWGTIWEEILRWLTGEKPTLSWTPTVRPTYAQDEAVPSEAERVALNRAAAWHRSSRLLVHPGEEADLHRQIARGTETRPAPVDGTPSGDGNRGILEGYASAIRHDGHQDQRIPLRADCQAESAMALAVQGRFAGDDECAGIATRLLDYLYFDSGLHGGVRGDERHPAYGLLAWGAHSPVWEVANYGDDNARALLATLLAASCLGSDRWGESVLRCILANFRTTGPLGFRGDRIDLPELEEKGWRRFGEREITNPAPHFEAYLWACYLWLYHRTGHRPFYERTLTALRLTMDAFPGGWRWGNHPESARMLLPLAWLLRIENTDEHRGWLRRIVDDLLETQQPCGALRERLRDRGTGHYTVPETNEAYGTKETPLLQEDGDPVSDQLYTSGFALLGLHEANAVLNVPRYQEAEDRLADFLCRIQTRSETLPYLDGTWFRAFDFRRWEYWASSADEGWGAWSVESGWGPAWTVATFGLRLQKTNLWDAIQVFSLPDLDRFLRLLGLEEPR